MKHVTDHNKIVEIQFQRSKQRIYAMDLDHNGDYRLVAEYECRDAFYAGYNEYGELRASLPNGTYEHVYAEITDGCYGSAYGNFYITTGDSRGRDIHGGGSGLNEPYADYQGWQPTLGCLRMQNVDGVELSAMIIASGNDVVLTVVE